MMAGERKPGRPSKYRQEYAAQAEKLCRLGATDKDLAEFFGVSEQTINAWKDAQPAFLESLKDGKAEADAKVERALFERATGYSHPDVHVSNYQGDVTITPVTKHYPPDTTACIFWLKNRRPDLWRDKQEREITGKDGGPMQVETPQKPPLDFDAVMRRLKTLDEQNASQGAK